MAGALAGGRIPVCLCLFVEWLWPFSFLFHGRSGATKPMYLQAAAVLPWASAVLPKCRVKKLGDVRRALGAGVVLAPGLSWGPRPCWTCCWSRVPTSLPLPTRSVRPLLSPPPTPHPFLPFCNQSPLGNV